MFKERGEYLAVGENRRGQRYECRVLPEAVSYLRDRTRGRCVSAEQADAVLNPVASPVLH